MNAKKQTFRCCDSLFIHIYLLDDLWIKQKKTITKIFSDDIALHCFAKCFYGFERKKCREQLLTDTIISIYFSLHCSRVCYVCAIVPQKFQLYYLVILCNLALK